MTRFSTSVSLSLEDKKYVKDNIKDFSAFVRKCIHEHRLLNMVGNNAEKLILEKIQKKEREFNKIKDEYEKEMIRLKDQLEKIIEAKQKEDEIKNHPFVLEKLKLIAQGKGKLPAICNAIKYHTNFIVTPAQLQAWAKELKQRCHHE